MAARGLDWNWAARTNGVLSAGDQGRMLAPVLRSALALAAQRTRIALGRRGSARLELEALRWPDSSLARDAETAARESLTPHVLQHSFRTYMFGRVLAALDGVAVDEELTFVASMLHDLNLEQPTPGRCFAVVGAERAHRFITEHGGSAELAARVRSAVCGHLTPGAADDLADPAGFVSAGALVDVLGNRLDELDPHWVADLLHAHPRLAFTRHLLAAMAAEAALVPHGRVWWLRRYALFPLLVRTAPFAE